METSVPSTTTGVSIWNHKQNFLDNKKVHKKLFQDSSEAPSRSAIVAHAKQNHIKEENSIKVQCPPLNAEGLDRGVCNTPLSDGLDERCEVKEVQEDACTSTANNSDAVQPSGSQIKEESVDDAKFQNNEECKIVENNNEKGPIYEMNVDSTEDTVARESTLEADQTSEESVVPEFLAPNEIAVLPDGTIIASAETLRLAEGMTLELPDGTLLTSQEEAATVEERDSEETLSSDEQEPYFETVAQHVEPADTEPTSATDAEVLYVFHSGDGVSDQQIVVGSDEQEVSTSVVEVEMGSTRSSTPGHLEPSTSDDMMYPQQPVLVEKIANDTPVMVIQDREEIIDSDLHKEEDLEELEEIENGIDYIPWIPNETIVESTEEDGWKKVKKKKKRKKLKTPESSPTDGESPGKKSREESSKKVSEEDMKRNMVHCFEIIDQVALGVIEGGWEASNQVKEEHIKPISSVVPEVEVELPEVVEIENRTLELNGQQASEQGQVVVNTTGVVKKKKKKKKKKDKLMLLHAAAVAADSMPELPTVFSPDQNQKEGIVMSQHDSTPIAPPPATDLSPMRPTQPAAPPIIPANAPVDQSNTDIAATLDPSLKKKKKKKKKKQKLLEVMYLQQLAAAGLPLPPGGLGQAGGEGKSGATTNVEDAPCLLPRGMPVLPLPAMAAHMTPAIPATMPLTITPPEYPPPAVTSGSMALSAPSTETKPQYSPFTSVSSHDASLSPTSDSVNESPIQAQHPTLLGLLKPPNGEAPSDPEAVVMQSPSMVAMQSPPISSMQSPPMPAMQSPPIRMPPFMPGHYPVPPPPHMFMGGVQPIGPPEIHTKQETLTHSPKKEAMVVPNPSSTPAENHPALPSMFAKVSPPANKVGPFQAAHAESQHKLPSITQAGFRQGSLQPPATPPQNKAVEAASIPLSPPRMMMTPRPIVSAVPFRPAGVSGPVSRPPPRTNDIRPAMVTQPPPPQPIRSTWSAPSTLDPPMPFRALVPPPPVSAPRYTHVASQPSLTSKQPLPPVSSLWEMQRNKNQIPTTVMDAEEEGLTCSDKEHARDVTLPSSQSVHGPVPPSEAASSMQTPGVNESLLLPPLFTAALNTATGPLAENKQHGRLPTSVPISVPPTSQTLRLPPVPGNTLSHEATFPQTEITETALPKPRTARRSRSKLEGQDMVQNMVHCFDIIDQVARGSLGPTEEDIAAMDKLLIPDEDNTLLSHQDSILSPGSKPFAFGMPSEKTIKGHPDNLLSPGSQPFAHGIPPPKAIKSQPDNIISPGSKPFVQVEPPDKSSNSHSDEIISPTSKPYGHGMPPLSSWHEKLPSMASFTAGHMKLSNPSMMFHPPVSFDGTSPLLSPSSALPQTKATSQATSQVRGPGPPLPLMSPSGSLYSTQPAPQHHELPLSPVKSQSHPHFGIPTAPHTKPKPRLQGPPPLVSPFGGSHYPLPGGRVGSQTMPHNAVTKSPGIPLTSPSQVPVPSGTHQSQTVTAQSSSAHKPPTANTDTPHSTGPPKAPDGKVHLPEGHHLFPFQYPWLFPGAALPPGFPMMVPTPGNGPIPSEMLQFCPPGFPLGVPNDAWMMHMMGAALPFSMMPMRPPALERKSDTPHMEQPLDKEALTSSAPGVPPTDVSKLPQENAQNQSTQSTIITAAQPENPQTTAVSSNHKDPETLADRYINEWKPTGKYQCKFCHYSCVTQNFLFRHWVTHHCSISPYMCAYCGNRSSNRHGITWHQSTKHKDKERKILVDGELESEVIKQFQKEFGYSKSFMPLESEKRINFDPNDQTEEDCEFDDEEPESKDSGAKGISFKADDEAEIAAFMIEQANAMHLQSSIATSMAMMSSSQPTTAPQSQEVHNVSKAAPGYHQVTGTSCAPMKPSDGRSYPVPSLQPTSTSMQSLYAAALRAEQGTMQIESGKSESAVAMTTPKVPSTQEPSLNPVAKATAPIVQHQWYQRPPPPPSEQPVETMPMQWHRPVAPPPGAYRYPPPPYRQGYQPEDSSDTIKALLLQPRSQPNLTPASEQSDSRLTAQDSKKQSTVSKEILKVPQVFLSSTVTQGQSLESSSTAVSHTVGANTVTLSTQTQLLHPPAAPPPHGNSPCGLDLSVRTVTQEHPPSRVLKHQQSSTLSVHPFTEGSKEQSHHTAPPGNSRADVNSAATEMTSGAQHHSSSQLKDSAAS